MRLDPVDLKIDAFLAEDFNGRIGLVNRTWGERLWSPQLAEIWAEVLDRTAGMAAVAGDVRRRLMRELIELAPDSPAAESAWRAWIGDADRAASPTPPQIVHVMLSCEKYKAKALPLYEQLSLHFRPLHILVGDGPSEAVFDGPFLRVPTPDDYESLTGKVLQGLIAVRRRYGRVGVLKFDDDTVFESPPKPERIAELVAATQYAGYVVGGSDFDRCWHAGKCERKNDEPYRRRFRGTWVGGRIYYLGPDAVDCLVRQAMFFPDEFAGEIFEDKAVGDCLRGHGIVPASFALSQVFGIEIAFDTPPGRAPMAAPTESRDEKSAPAALAAARRNRWDDFFRPKEDPWDYGNKYETIKYQQTLELLPEQPIGQALELACAEGHFTEALAAKVERLTATDISSIAVTRARERCARLHNVEVRQLDFVSDELPHNLDLLLCSEALYYLSRAQLAAMPDKFASALKPGGHLLMANPVALADDRDRTGFDWGHDFGAKSIAEAFGACRGLALVKELRTTLYRVQLYRRVKPGEVLPTPEVVEAALAVDLPAQVARTVIWDGAILTRAEARERELAADLPILMYHSVAENGAPELAPYRVSPQRLQEQLRYLRRNGYHSISVEEWARAIESGEKIRGRPVLFTFDDGYKDFYDQAAPLFEAADFRATVFVVTDMVGGTAEWDHDVSSGAPLSLMDWRQLRDLQQRGFEIGSHTAAHRDLLELTDEEIVSDSLKARETLRRELGRNVVSVAFPWGRHDERVIAALARGGYKQGLDVCGGRSQLYDNPLRLPRIEILGADDLATFARRLDAKSVAARPSPPAPQRLGPPETRPDAEAGKEKIAMTPEYVRLLAARVGTLVEALAGLQMELLNASEAPNSTQSRLKALFSLPLTNATRKLTPYEPLASGVVFGFQDTAESFLRVLPKPSHGVSPESCLNVVELDYSGTSSWFTLEVAASWIEIITAHRYQLSIHAHPDRPVGVKLALRLPQKDGSFVDHLFAATELLRDRRPVVAAGQLKLPEIDPDQDRAPTLLFFFDSDRDLKLRLDYINVYFA